MKLSEVRAILGNASIEIDSRDLDGMSRDLFLRCGKPMLRTRHFAPVPELQGTTQQIALEKCRRAAEILQGPCITEDTALCFEALNGLPGPYIKFFLKELGLDGTR